MMLEKQEHASIYLEVCPHDFIQTKNASVYFSFFYMILDKQGCGGWWLVAKGEPRGAVAWRELRGAVAEGELLGTEEVRPMPFCRRSDAQA